MTHAVDDPLLNRSSLRGEALAGEVIVTFAHVARAGADLRDERPSVGSLKTLLADERRQRHLLLLLGEASGTVDEPVLSAPAAGRFRDQFLRRDAHDRAYMTSVASRLLGLPHLRLGMHSHTTARPGPDFRRLREGRRWRTSPPLGLGVVAVLASGYLILGRPFFEQYDDLGPVRHGAVPEGERPRARSNERTTEI